MQMHLELISKLLQRPRSHFDWTSNGKLRACWALRLFLKLAEVELSFANNFRVCAQSENKKEVGKVMSTSLRHVPQVEDLRLYLGGLHDCS